MIGISTEELRQQVEEIIGEAQHQLVRFGSIELTARAFKVLQLSRREALRLGRDYIGSEHILLGLIAEHEGVAAQVLHRLGADVRGIRAVLRSNLISEEGVGRSALLSIYSRLASIDPTLSALHVPRGDEPDSYDQTPQGPGDATA